MSYSHFLASRKAIASEIIRATLKMRSRHGLKLPNGRSLWGEVKGPKGGTESAQEKTGR